VIQLRWWDLAVVVRCLGGDGLVVMAPLAGGSGGSGHTLDPVSGETRPASLAPIRGARVPVGRPLGPIWIRVIGLYAGLGGDSGTGMTSTTPSATATPSSPSLGLGDE
jgi:hypothetical protein